MDSITRIKNVQKIQGKISLLQSEIDKKKERISGAEKGLEKLIQQSPPLHERLKQGQGLVKKFELDVAELSDLITKSQKQLDKASQASEYNGLKVQIGRYEEEKSSAEGNLLLILEKIEEINHQIEDLTSRASQAQDQLTEIQSEVGKEIEEYQVEISALEGPLAEARSTTDPELLEVFDRLFPGVGATVVVEADGKICGGCYMSLSPQVIEKVQKKTEVVCCPICSRILC